MNKLFRAPLSVSFVLCFVLTGLINFKYLPVANAIMPRNRSLKECHLIFIYDSWK